MSDQVSLALITCATVLINLLFNAWESRRKRRAEVEDREWKAAQEARSAVAAAERKALKEQAETLQMEVQANTAVSTTGAAAAVKNLAHSTGEPEHKIVADLSEVNRRLAATFAPYLPGETDAQAEPTHPAGRRGTRSD